MIVYLLVNEYENSYKDQVRIIKDCKIAVDEYIKVCEEYNLGIYFGLNNIYNDKPGIRYMTSEKKKIYLQAIEVEE